MTSPSLMDSVGHSGSHAPHEMHSSVIFIAMVQSPQVLIWMQKLASARHACGGHSKARLKYRMRPGTSTDKCRLFSCFCPPLLIHRQPIDQVISRLPGRALFNAVVICDPQQIAAIRIHDVDLGISVSLRDEGNAAAIR